MQEVSASNSPNIEQIKEESNRLQGLLYEVGKVIVGQEDVLQFIVLAILCDGHILLEGMPGVAKTSMIKAIAKGLGLSFNRIQFTPDLLPSDVIGTPVYNPKIQDFETKKGPIFANLILADEINRAPAKVQSALLEAMQEHQVTIGSTTYKLDEPFLVFATQNPVEQEGTYKLPEAQVDRFMFKLLVKYPQRHQEREIIKRDSSAHAIQQILTRDDIKHLQETVKKIYVDDKILDYIVSLVFATRFPHESYIKDIEHYILHGVSPRATIALYRAAQAYAFLKGRGFVTPDDVKAVAGKVLSHRVILTYQAEADEVKPEAVIGRILNSVPTP
jgi:MoxR-like ATPase